MENNLSIEQGSKLHDFVGETISDLEKTAHDSRIFHDLGINTNLAQAVENFFVKPTEFLDKMRIVHNEMFSQLFMLWFLHLVTESQLSKLVSGYAVRVNGAEISLWVTVKDEHFTFENRARFYQLISELLNVPQFEKTNVDFLLLTEGDLHIPESFKHTRV